MKRTAIGVFLLLSAGTVSRAQTGAAQEAQALNTTNVAPPFFTGAATTEGGSDSFRTRAFAPDPDLKLDLTPTSPVPAVRALATPSPEPAPDRGGYTRTMYGATTWELAIGVDLFRFNSSVFKASAVGTKTSVAYFRKDWLGIEGVVSTAFAPQIYANEHVKLLTYGAGPKIVWRRSLWDPWMHAILGGAHEFPQTAVGSKNGLGAELGGGVDYHFFERLSGRLEGNYVLTRFFGQTQNNFQLAAGVVFNF